MMVDGLKRVYFLTADGYREKTWSQTAQPYELKNIYNDDSFP